jgi:hypothetical protein
MRPLTATTFVVPGNLIQPINPVFSTREPGNPFYLFDSTSLMALGSCLLDRFSRIDVQAIPTTNITQEFPYRAAESGKITLTFTMSMLSSLPFQMPLASLWNMLIKAALGSH